MSLGRRTAGYIASCPAFRHNLPCMNTWKENAGELPAREAAKDVEGSFQNKKVSGTKVQYQSQRLTVPLLAGSLGIPGDITSSRDPGPAREETQGSSGNTGEPFCHMCTIRQPALGRKMPHTRSNIPKWCICCSQQCRDEVCAKADARRCGCLPRS